MEMSPADCLKQKIHLVEEKHQSLRHELSFDGDFWILFFYYSFYMLLLR